MPAAHLPAFDALGFLEAARTALAPLATAERAAQEQRYLKSALQHRGNTKPQLRKVIQTVSRQWAPPVAAELARLTQLAWSSGWYEDRALCTLALERHHKRLNAADLPWLEVALRDSHTWALVDELALQVVAPIWHRDRNGCQTVLDRWAADHDFWLQRTALLATLGAWRRAKPSGSEPFDTQQFEAWALPVLTSKEFFLRKAVGWILREVAKREPAYVLGFVARYGAQLSALARREALRGVEMVEQA